MFGQKLTRHAVQRHLGRAKDFLGKAYNRTKSFLGDVDYSVGQFRRLYGAVAPVLMDELGAGKYTVGKGLHKNIMKGLTTYDDLRNRVGTAHDRVVDNVQNAMRKM